MHDPIEEPARETQATFTDTHFTQAHYKHT